MPLQRILSACCHSDQELRPSIESILDHLLKGLIPQHLGHAPNTSAPLGTLHTPSGVGNAATNAKEEASIPPLGNPSQRARKWSRMWKSVQEGLGNIRDGVASVFRAISCFNIQRSPGDPYAPGGGYREERRTTAVRRRFDSRTYAPGGGYRVERRAIRPTYHTTIRNVHGDERLKERKKKGGR